MVSPRSLLPLTLAALAALSCAVAPKAPSSSLKPTPRSTPAWTTSEPAPAFPEFEVAPNPSRAFQPGEIARLSVTLKKPAEPGTQLELGCRLSIPYEGPRLETESSLPYANTWKLLHCLNAGATHDEGKLSIPIPEGDTTLVLELQVRPTQSFQSPWTIPKDIGWHGQGVMVTTPAVRSYLAWEERQARAALHDGRDYKPLASIPQSRWIELRFPLAPKGPDDGQPSWVEPARSKPAKQTGRP